MSELEALSNKELRAKCMEYGMPNVPVTDSSRKILIRRLEAAISGKPVTPAKTNRRETMHVSKPSEIASSPKITINNNTAVAGGNKQTPVGNRASRRTIAVPERHVATTTTVSEPEYSDVSPDRGEQQPIVAPKTKTPEKPTMTLYPKLPAKELSPKPQILSKTGVVTTSFVQEAKATGLNKTYAAPDDVDSAEELPIEVKKPAVVIPPMKSYVPLSESKVTTSNPLSSTLSSSTRYSSLGSSGLSYNVNQPTSYTSSMTTSSNVRKNYAAPTTTTSYSQYSRTAPRAATYANDFDDAEFEDEEDYDGEEEEDDDVVVVEDSPVGKDIQTPFLSQFARNLENLKATPLRHSVGPTKITPPKSTTLRNRENVGSAYTRRTMAYTGPSNIAPRRSLKDPQQDDSPFRQFMMTMEEKYHLKQTFCIISIFIVAVFIYVFFIQSI